METVATLVFKIYRGTPQHADWVVACLQGAWPRLVGETLARVCSPSSIAGSRLTIEILDADWAQAIRSMREELTDKLRTATDREVQHLSFCCRFGNARLEARGAECGSRKAKAGIRGKKLE